MSRRARVLARSPSAGVPGPSSALEAVSSSGPGRGVAPETQVQPLPPPLLVIALGNLKDGRHVAMELHVRGREVVGGTVLCASQYSQPAARAWEQCAYLRLGRGEEYGDLEQAANARDGKGVEVAHLDFALAAAIAPQGKRFAATAMEIEGGVVSEPRLLCVDDRLTAWSTVAAWAAQHLLPRRRG